MFAILDPIILPNTISLLSLIIASKLTKSSGDDVANETIVIPATSLEILNFCEKPTEPLTKNSPPKYKRKNPKI